MIKENFKINQGISMIELLFYIAVFSVLFLVVVNSMIFMTRSFKESVINTDLTQSATILERISREVKNASGINTISTTSLKLDNINVVDSLSTTISFVLNGTNLQLYDGNNALIGNLNSSNVSVTDLRFTQINTIQGTAVKIFMTVKSNHYNSIRTENFYDTIVLRGDYQ